MSRSALSLFASFALLLPAAGFAAEKPAEKTADPVVARVGKLEIRRSELDGIWNRIDPESKKLWESSGGKAAFLRDVAAKKRLILDAERKGIDRLPEVVLDIAISRDSILFDRYLMREVLPLLMSDEYVKGEYEKRKSSFLQPKRWHARHILVTPKKDDKVTNANFDDAKSPEEAKKKIDFLVKRLADGVDFVQLAKDYSEDTTAARGGDLGWFGKGAMVKEFEDAVGALAPGKVSPVVETVFGFHLIRLEGTEEESYLPFEKVKDQLRQQLLADRVADIQKKGDEVSSTLQKDYPLEILDPELRLP